MRACTSPRSMTHVSFSPYSLIRCSKWFARRTVMPWSRKAFSRIYWLAIMLSPGRASPPVLWLRRRAPIEIMHPCGGTLGGVVITLGLPLALRVIKPHGPETGLTLQVHPTDVHPRPLLYAASCWAAGCGGAFAASWALAVASACLIHSSAVGPYHACCFQLTRRFPVTCPCLYAILSSLLY